MDDAMGDPLGKPGGGDQWFRDIAESANYAFFVIRTRPDVAVEFISETIVNHLGYTADELTSDPQLLASRIDPIDAAELAGSFAMAPGEQRVHELRWIHRDGHPAVSQSWVRSRERDDGSAVIEGMTHEVTDIREAEWVARLFEDRYRLMAESANIVLWTMALDGTITYISPTVEKMRGFTVAEAMVQPLDEILTPESQQIVADYYGRLYADMAEGKVPGAFRCEQEYLCKDGSTIWTEVEVIPYLGADGQVSEILGITRDVSERKHYLDEVKASRDEAAAANAALQVANEELNRLAVTDTLTGVWNRRRGEELLESDLAQSRRYGTPTSALIVDIDQFKPINDTRGHHVGDEVLIQVTRLLRSNLRSTDELVRWGGDEFIILTHHCSLAEASALAEKLREIVATEHFVGADAVTISIGVAELTANDDITTWLSRADDALYRAKAAGRNAVREAV